MYRVCKSFDVESGHMLSKHPGNCRYPHGHTRRVEVVVAAETLDAGDMVCDFAALRVVVQEVVGRFDHSLAVNSQDPDLRALKGSGRLGERLIVFPGQDPTTEAMAKFIYDHVAARLSADREVIGPTGTVYRLPPGLVLERVRVGETPSSWAEYGRS